jgi:hypothetical protein
LSFSPALTKDVTDSVTHSPLYVTTPNMLGKAIVRMGLFDEVPPVVAEIYTRNRRSWEPAIENAQHIEGGPPGPN